MHPLEPRMFEGRSHIQAFILVLLKHFFDQVYTLRGTRLEFRVVEVRLGILHFMRDAFHIIAVEREVAQDHHIQNDSQGK